MGVCNFYIEMNEEKISYYSKLQYQKQPDVKLRI